MSAPAEFEVFAEAVPNLIRVRYLGHVTVAGVEAACAALVALLPQMRAHFTVLTDLSGLESMDIASAAPLARVMEACRKAGVGMVVRVIPDRQKDIGFNILSIIHYREHVRIVTCDTLAEAERVIAPAAKQD